MNNDIGAKRCLRTELRDRRRVEIELRVVHRDSQIDEYHTIVGYDSVIFVTVDETYYCDLILSQQLLPAMGHVSSKVIL